MDDVDDFQLIAWLLIVDVIWYHVDCGCLTFGICFDLKAIDNVATSFEL